VGRFAHRLLAQADGMQAVEFKDPVSGQLLSQAFAPCRAVRTGATTVTPQPFFENQVVNWAPYDSGGTQFVADYIVPYVVRGDLADSVQLLNEYNYFDGVGLNLGLA